jgi:hypothetical protein
MIQSNTRRRANDLTFSPHKTGDWDHLDHLPRLTQTRGICLANYRQPVWIGVKED